MIPNFERNKSGWQIRVAIHEIIRINILLDAFGRDTTPHAVVWLVKVSPNRRSWIVRDRAVTSWITADAGWDDPHFALPIPEYFFRHLFDIAQDDDGIDLYCNEADGTIVASSGERYMAVDEPVGLTFGIRDLPYRGEAPRHGTRPAVATVQVSDLHTFSNVAHNLPRGSANEEVRPPFISIAIGDGMFAFTADWRRHGLGRMTAAVPARTTGSITTQFYPYTVARILRAQDASDEATIFVDGDDAEHLYFSGDDWGIRVLQDDEITGRWYKQVALELSQNECDVVPHSTDSYPRVMKFSSRNVNCTGRFIIRDGIHDIFQISSTLQSRVEETIDIFDMVNTINAELVGAQVVLQNGMLTVKAECLIEDDGAPAKCMKAVLDGVEKCARNDTLLPLFAPQS